MGRKIGLTNKQKVFVDEYLKDLNATQAAIRAGYKGRNHDDIGYQLLRKTLVAAAIAEAQAKRAEKSGITSARVIQELVRVGLYDIRAILDASGNVLTIDEIPEDARRAIAGIDIETAGGDDRPLVTTKKIRMADKLKALELLGRHLGLFVDRTRIEGDTMTFVLSGGPAPQPAQKPEPPADG